MLAARILTANNPVCVHLEVWVGNLRQIMCLPAFANRITQRQLQLQCFRHRSAEGPGKVANYSDATSDSISAGCLQHCMQEVLALLMMVGLRSPTLLALRVRLIFSGMSDHNSYSRLGGQVRLPAYIGLCVSRTTITDPRNGLSRSS